MCFQAWRQSGYFRKEEKSCLREAFKIVATSGRWGGIHLVTEHSGPRLSRSRMWHVLISNIACDRWQHYDSSDGWLGARDLGPTGLNTLKISFANISYSFLSCNISHILFLPSFPSSPHPFIFKIIFKIFLKDKKIYKK